MVFYQNEELTYEQIQTSDIHLTSINLAGSRQFGFDIRTFGSALRTLGRALRTFGRDLRTFGRNSRQFGNP